ncbi:MAG TPA: hypothetical protein VNM16_02900 [Bacillota bacterium]|nr:hypothetical protein [Bacillota bacterium]
MDPELKAYLERIERDMAAIKADMAATKADVAATKADMAATKADMAATKADVAATRVLVENRLVPEQRQLAEGLATLRHSLESRLDEVTAELRKDILVTRNMIEDFRDRLEAVEKRAP